MRRAILFVYLGFLAGCVEQQETFAYAIPEAQAEDVAWPPKPSNTRKYVTDYLNNSLKDPDSLKDFSITEPRKGWWTAGIFNGFKNEPLWYVCYSYNAKNSYGGYVGKKNYVLFFEGDQAKDAPIETAQDNTPWKNYWQCEI